MREAEQPRWSAILTALKALFCIRTNYSVLTFTGGRPHDPESQHTWNCAENEETAAK